MTALPDWAPERLVVYYERRLQMPIPSPTAKQQYESFKLYAKGLTPEITVAYEDYEISFYRGLSRLPHEEGNELLLRMLTEQNMRSVWLTLNRYAPEGFDYLQYWEAVEEAVLSWKGHSRRTPKEHTAHFLEIARLSSRLEELISDTQELREFSPADAMPDQDLHTVAAGLPDRIPGDISKLPRWYHVGPYIPTLGMILQRLQLKALSILKEAPLAKEPRSKDAAIQHFVRFLGLRVDRICGQPLHQVVADTASVVFNELIDKERVRYLRSTTHKRPD